jgi:hypothetical protein
MQQVRAKLKAYPNLRVSVRNPQTFNLGGPNFDVDFAILGPELASLMSYAEQLRLKAPELGLIDADTTLKLDKPEYQVEIDRDRTARLGVDSEAIATALRLMVGGDVKVSRFRDPSVNDDYYVQLRLKDGHRNDPGTIARLFVPGQNDNLIRLDNVVNIVARPTASRIDRLDRQRMVALRASVAPGFAMADRIAALKAEAENMNLPPGYTTRVSGQARELEKTFVEFLWAFALSVILMYLILASQFESLVHPFTILLSLPISVPFALLTLYLTGTAINLYSALGILVLFGVVKKNAILQVDHTNKLRASGMERSAAIMQANRDRLRPILMTTLTLVAGMLRFMASPPAWRTGRNLSFDTRKPLPPNIVKGYSGLHIAKAVFGDFTETAFPDQVVHIHAGHPVALGRVNAECLAVKVQIETTPGAFASAHAVERELLGQVAMRRNLVAIAEPVLARDGHIQQGGTQVKKGHIEAAPVESDNGIVMFGDLPESGQQLRLIHHGGVLDRARGQPVGLEIVRDEKDFAAGLLGVEHGNADNLGRQGPQVHLHSDFRLPGLAGRQIVQLGGIPKEIFPLGLVERLHGQGRSFNVEDQCRHNVRAFSSPPPR